MFQVQRRCGVQLKKQTIITTEAVDAEDVQEFDSFDEAYAALMAQLDPGGSIDLHEETCALTRDEPECDCTPHRITKGAQA
jgi:hypothetical protein